MSNQIICFPGPGHHHDDDKHAFENDHDTTGHPYKEEDKVPTGIKDDDELKKLFDQWLAEKEGQAPEGPGPEGPGPEGPEGPGPQGPGPQGPGPQGPGPQGPMGEKPAGAGQYGSQYQHAKYDQYGRLIRHCVQNI